MILKKCFEIWIEEKYAIPQGNITKTVVFRWGMVPNSVYKGGHMVATLIIATLVAIAAAVVYRGMAKNEASRADGLSSELGRANGRRYRLFPGVEFPWLGGPRSPSLDEARGAEKELSALLEGVRKFRTALEAVAADPETIRETHHLSFRLECLGEKAETAVSSWTLYGFGWYVVFECSNDAQWALISTHGADESAARASAAEAETRGIMCSCGNQLNRIGCRYGRYPE
ncbi:MAG: hypothetical protein AAB849_02920 [Patescibacteria group bacterium]